MYLALFYTSVWGESQSEWDLGLVKERCGAGDGVEGGTHVGRIGVDVG